GTEFIIFTDPNPIIFATQHPDNTSPRQLRLLGIISQFSTDIPYKSSLAFKFLAIQNSDKLPQCDTSCDRIRPWVPKTLRKRVIENIYSIAHSERKAILKLIKDIVFLPEEEEKVAAQ
uniref:Uncharacterized protein n=1 Tax=Megaselia scalaris TaxID=36166 RepID=T1H4C9_MEGSC